MTAAKWQGCTSIVLFEWVKFGTCRMCRNRSIRAHLSSLSYSNIHLTTLRYGITFWYPRKHRALPRFSSSHHPPTPSGNRGNRVFLRWACFPAEKCHGHATCRITAHTSEDEKIASMDCILVGANKYLNINMCVCMFTKIDPYASDNDESDENWISPFRIWEGCFYLFKARLTLNV